MNSFDLLKYGKTVAKRLAPTASFKIGVSVMGLGIGSKLIKSGSKSLNEINAQMFPNSSGTTARGRIGRNLSSVPSPLNGMKFNFRRK